MPSLLFDTAAEDVNRNGLLDPANIDNDGDLDVPNVYPEGGDPREDLLTWYERITNTLIVRPVVPLREENTYAVVLTERLVDAAGEPVRSPWPWVHHAPNRSARPHCRRPTQSRFESRRRRVRLTFTTGRVTGDLVDIRRSLRR